LAKIKPSAAAALLCAAILAIGGAASLAVHSYHRVSIPNMLRRASLDNPNALWHVVHDLCLPNMAMSGRPQPCTAVDRAGGFAIVKDVLSADHYLLVPTIKISGIESPALMEPDAKSYWRAAWEARRYIERSIGRDLPREDVGLAVNSRIARTQEQLHIHIACVRADVRVILQSRQTELGPAWTHVKFEPWDPVYKARWISEADFAAHDPFKLLAAEDAAAKANMAKQTLVLIGASHGNEPGFVLLSHQAEYGDNSSGEALLDHRCAVVLGASRQRRIWGFGPVWR
jgi:CDP-diacylglycerol pyrophosphatase